MAVYVSSAESSKPKRFLIMIMIIWDADNAIFLKYSKESRSPSSHGEIRNVPSDFCYRWYLKNKTGVRCAKRTPNAVA